MPLEAEATPPSKRRKTNAAAACSVCRVRKTACDRQRPSCTSCTLRGWQDKCEYQETISQPPTLTIIDIEKRLRQLESQPRPVSTDRSTAVGSVPGYVGRETSNHDGQRFRDSSNRLQEEDESVYGPASTAGFSREIAMAVDSSGDQSGQQGRTASYMPAPMVFPERFQTSNLGCDIKDLILPPRQLADAMLQCYWDYLHPVYFILHKPSFEADYQRVWQSSAQAENEADVAFYSMLNIVLALGCSRYDGLPTKQRDDLSRDLYERSCRLLPVETLNKSSLAIVQCLHLRGTYLFYSPYADRCWNITSVAIRMAQAIGLDAPKIHRAPSNQLVREMRRRVWYSCIVLDRLIANTFGRPVILHVQESVSSPNLSIPMPALIDDEYLSATEEGCQPPDEPPRLGYMHHSLRLQEALGRVLAMENKYVASGNGVQDGNGWSTPSLRAEIEGLLQSVDDFELWLPNYLQVQEGHFPRPQKLCFTIQAFSLKARAAYIRLRILRPLMIINARRRLSLKRHDCILEDLSRLCMSAATSVLDILYGSLPVPDSTFPWHTLYYTFAAASVLVAGTWFPALDVNLDVEPAKTSWSRALAIFEFYKNQVSSAEKGAEALCRLRSYGQTRGPTNKTVRLRSQSGPDKPTASRTSDATLIATGTPRQTITAIISTAHSPNLFGDGDTNRLHDVQPDFTWNFYEQFSLDQSWLTFEDFLGGEQAPGTL